MSFRMRDSAWRKCIAPLRQEASTKGVVGWAALQSALEALRAADVDIPEQEIVEDLSFLVQQLLGPQVSIGKALRDNTVRDTAAHVVLCRLLASLASNRIIRFHPSAANLILGALRQWADSAQDAATHVPAGATTSGGNAIPGTTSSTTGANSAAPSAAPDISAAPAVPSTGGNLQLECLAALAALLPSHLGLLSEHERAAQLAALHSLLVPHLRGLEPAWGTTTTSNPGAADVMELQCLALTTMAACCVRPPGGVAGSGVAGSGAPAAGGGASLTPDETAALLSAAVLLLQRSCTGRSRPVEGGAHSRWYAALLRALHVGLVEAANRAAWVSRTATLVECLQRFFTYGVQASLAAAASLASSSSGGATSGCSTTPSTPAAAAASMASPVMGSSRRYLPPHLRRQESQADGAAGGGGGYSDSDTSDTEHAGFALGVGSRTSGGVVDRFRSSRVRMAALSCIQAMAKSDPRALHTYWTALLPLQNPLQPRPLTPHLLTVLIHDPVAKIRAMAASTLANLVDGPAQRSILTVAEAKSMTSRGPPRGFLTLSLSLGQLLLGAHAGLLHAAAHEGSGLVLPGVLRALVTLMAATPYERMPPELLPEVVKALRARWAALSASPSTLAPGELGPVHAAYLACLAECFSTKQPIAGLAAYLQQQIQQGSSQAGSGAVDDTECVGSSSGGGAEELVRELVAVGRDQGAAAVLRIEALGSLKGLATHYTFALPRDVWDDLRTTAAVGLSSCTPPPRSPRSREGPSPLRSSSSSLSGVGPASVNTWLQNQTCERNNPPREALWSRSGTASGAAAGPSGAGSTLSPEDKAAQLSVKLISEYLAAIALQYGLRRTDTAGTSATEGDVPTATGAIPPGQVPLGPPVPRVQPSQRAQPDRLSLTSADGEEGVRRLVARWQDAVGLLVPAATSHVSCMVQSAGLSCLGEIPEPVFSSLPPTQQQRILTLLTDAAATASVVAATRAAACRALGVVAAFSAMLVHDSLSGAVARALALCLRDSVQSVRIAASWAVANMCDAHRQRLMALEESGGGDDSGGRNDTQSDQEGSTQQEADQRLLRGRSKSHAQASTAVDVRSTSDSGRGGDASVRDLAPALQPHHYRQLAVLCGEAIIATQDADKVRANGIRAVGNLLAALTPAMGPGLEAASRAGTTAISGNGSGSTTAGDASSRVQGDWRRGRVQGEPAAINTGGSSFGRMPIATTWGEPAHRAGRSGDSCGGGCGAVLHLDMWLDSALTCLQSSLTTGNMKVQWNACYAVHGLLRNVLLRAHPRVAPRVPPLLLLLVMLVRESGNFKIRIHAAAALAALADRDAYGDVLPDALLVVASALEGLSGGSSAAGAAPSTVVGPASTTGAAGAASRSGVPEGWGGSVDLGGGGAGIGGEDGDGGEGRFPNFRYSAGLCAQLRATLLHLLALSRPPDARRVREALTRRAEFLHVCLRDQLAEATRALRVLQATAAAAARPDTPDGGRDLRLEAGARIARDAAAPKGNASSGRVGAGALELPLDPFGLAGASGGRGASPRDAAGAGGMAGLLAGLHLSGDEFCGLQAAAASSPRDSDGSRQGLPMLASEQETGGGWGADELRRARKRVMLMAGPLRGFCELLMQLGPGCEPVRLDVQQALAQLSESAATQDA